MGLLLTITVIWAKFQQYTDGSGANTWFKPPFKNRGSLNRRRKISNGDGGFLSRGFFDW
jgi:hypothetical protein